MSKLGTLRERVERASEYFHDLDGVMLTTFNLSATFLEDHVLPTVLGVEAKTTASRRAELHHRLGTTPCTVFYDPAHSPKLSGRYRYIARPVPIRGRFFHPKLVALAGRSADGTTWVYLAVSSANLTPSGWGHNVESFGETWIHTRRQQSWASLDDLLSWLGNHSSLGEQKADTDAVTRIRAALARMPERRRFSDHGNEPWSGTLYTDLYVSVVHTGGLPAFLQGNRTRPSSELWAYSPYWSDVAQQVAAFNVRKTVLVPALRKDGKRLGLSQEQAVELNGGTEIQRNEDDVGNRFWHMKAYWIQHGKTIRTAVGSCNFTCAGLSGGDGNVEAMLVFDVGPPTGYRKDEKSRPKSSPKRLRLKRTPPSRFRWLSSWRGTGELTLGDGGWMRARGNATSSSTCRASPRSESSQASTLNRASRPRDVLFSKCRTASANGNENGRGRSSS